jgi:CheY-like chemotaxis protein
MPALALISDLLARSQATTAAGQAGVELAIAGTEDSLIAQAEKLRPRLVIVDLSHPGLDPRRLMDRLQPFVGPGATSLAFAPHVHKERLTAAAEAGFGVVISRGRFYAEMADLLKRFAT